MNWIFLVLGIIFAIPTMWTWQKMKAKESVKMTRKTFFICCGLALFFIISSISLIFSKDAIIPIIALIDLAFFISLILTVYYAVKRKKQMEEYKAKLKYSSLATIGFFALFAFSVTNLPEVKSNEPASSESHQEQTQSSKENVSKASGSSSENEENTSSDSLTETEVKTINKQLVRDLKDDQQDATNGNKNYDWTNWILKITINSSWQATVNVDGDFINLSEAARNEVASHANGLIGRSIVTAGIDYSPEQSREGIYMNFHNGPQYLGRSSFINHTKIKWNKKYFN